MMSIYIYKMYILYIEYIHNTICIYIYKNMTEYDRILKRQKRISRFWFLAGNLWKRVIENLILFYGIPPIKQPFLRGLLSLFIQG